MVIKMDKTLTNSQQGQASVVVLPVFDHATLDECLSALADGQLDGDGLQQTLNLLGTGEQGQMASYQVLATWNSYHLIGDVLRANDLAGCGGEMAFVRRLQARLADEVMVVADQKNAIESIAAPVGLASGSTLNVVKPTELAANDSNMRWKWAAGTASLAAVIAVSWSAIGFGAAKNEPTMAQLPSSGVAVPAASGPLASQPMLRDARLDELLAAHRQIGGTSALQMPSGFLRNATFEQAGR
jgi:sigma-E factor negative regulatory protein RseA